MIKNKVRYKPLYKKFVHLRKNIQNKKRVNLFLFKAKKWKNLFKFLVRQNKIKKKNYRIYDLNSNFIKRYGNLHKKKFLLNLLNKQSLSLFYGKLKNKYLKQLIKTIVKVSKKKKEYNTNSIINLLESRLDTVLYRSKFVKSFREARNIIKHGHVLLNNRKVTETGYILKKGDFICFSSLITSRLKNNVLNSNMWPLPSQNSVLNYRLLNIVFLENNNITLFYNMFPFYINFNTIIRYYTKT